ncbi:hypothetical protein PRECH8_10440 [Insulibacter thermoxylanivorax]|uniref:Uncharacterized protein n=1 Tax=Insulibacter thermoxylanivorax TaxID=2749268 RepID=A0A916VFD1_9BACL|nr:hypothetical protein [Insulibacter thermoxylanivorax]GFR37748.1 hypothetical protein PRECH8_10440 [Insulibacter thermoxylanivorax]
MENKPYYCPNCRSNRVKFNIISSTCQRMIKDAITGEVLALEEPEALPQEEATIQCLVCQFMGNEMRFIKQAEREPRIPQPQLLS